MKSTILNIIIKGCLMAALSSSVDAIDIPYQRRVDLGPRPFFLVNDMEESELKRKLLKCAKGPFRKSDFSIGHRGACMQFPEETKESFIAAAGMGAGIVECDVTFTKDKQLVCRHAQNDLHTSTNILTIPDLAAKCTKPFRPATFDRSGVMLTEATAECLTSDITLSEFKRLRGKMDGYNPQAKTPEEYTNGTPSWRTDLYSGPTSGTLMTHKESIELFRVIGVKMAPELKKPIVNMPYDGMTQEDYALKMIDEYRSAGVNPSNVYPQSFSKSDILTWIKERPAYSKQAVYLDDAQNVEELPSLAELIQYKAEGINIVASPLFALLESDGDGKIQPSKYALNANQAGLGIIAFTIERSGILSDGNNGFLYQTFDSAIKREGDVMMVLDILAKDIGVMGVFSDWPATVTYYSSCMRIK